MVVAAEEERITPWTFTELLPAAMPMQKRLEVQRYPNVRHAFHRPKWEGYHASTAVDADRRVHDFLREQRKGGPEGPPAGKAK